MMLTKKLRDDLKTIIAPRFQRYILFSTAENLAPSTISKIDSLLKVMKDWSDLEEKYQEMREKDPNSAEDFKKKMTERFQKTVQALEEESQAEKRQLQAMHQQRVISMINQKKKMAMSCYTKALNENAPNTHRVQKCLQKLLRALHKDRHHTIQHFRHLLETSLDQVI